MTQLRQNLDVTAASLADALTHELVKPFHALLATYEGTFPGITGRVAPVIDRAALKAAFRTEVALLIKDSMEQETEESLRTALTKVDELRNQLSNGAVLTQDAARVLITKAGGIFIGKEELVRLGELDTDAVVPEIPAKYSKAFLEAAHPFRSETIASHITLAFDRESNAWHSIDRGEGGKSDIVPGSLGNEGRGLIGTRQDRLLTKNGAQIKVEGVVISPHEDSFPIERILNNAVALHLAAGKPIDTAPLRGIFGRTGDFRRGTPGCRIVLGCPDEGSVRVLDSFHSLVIDSDVGLLAGWN